MNCAARNNYAKQKVIKIKILLKLFLKNLKIYLLRENLDVQMQQPSFIQNLEPMTYYGKYS